VTDRLRKIRTFDIGFGIRNNTTDRPLSVTLKLRPCSAILMLILLLYFHWISASDHWALSWNELLCVKWALVTVMQCNLILSSRLLATSCVTVFCMSVGCYKLEMWLWSNLTVSNVSAFCVYVSVCQSCCWLFCFHLFAVHFSSVF